MAKIKQNDTVKVIAGGLKGKIGKVVRVDEPNHQVYVEGVNVKERHIKPSQANPRGGKKDVHIGIDISNVALVIDGKEKTSRVGYKVTADGKVRIAKATNKEIK